MAKSIIVSDIHFHNWKKPGDNSADRLYYQYHSMVELASLAEEQEAVQIFNCGDTFHTPNRLDVPVIYQANQSFNHMSAAIRQPVISLTGNHDISKFHSLHHNSAISALQWDCNITIYRTAFSLGIYESTPVFKKRPSFKWAAIPYTNDKNTLLNAFFQIERLAPEKYVVFMHQGVANVPMGSGFVIDEIFSPNMIPKNVTHVFTGHYHSHRRVDDRLTVIGSPMQHTRADEGEAKGFLIFDDETMDFEFHENRISPEFKTFSWDYIKCFKKLDEKELINELKLAIAEVVDVPFDEDIEEIRDFMSDHVYSVEFTRKEKPLPINIEDKESTFNLEELVNNISKELDPKYQDVDRKIRGGEYEV